MSVEPQAGPAERLLGSRLELNCEAEASPAPTFRWVRHTNRGVESVSHQAKVVLEEVSYEDQGEYFCEVEKKEDIDMSLATRWFDASRERFDSSPCDIEISRYMSIIYHIYH